MPGFSGFRVWSAEGEVQLFRRVEHLTDVPHLVSGFGFQFVFVFSFFCLIGWVYFRYGWFEGQSQNA